MTYQRRDKLLRFLDVIGKWSLIDTFFMLIMVVAFRFVRDNDAGGVPISFNTAVHPLFPFYCFVLATMLSLILTHIMIYEHRRTIEDENFCMTSM